MGALVHVQLPAKTVVGRRQADLVVGGPPVGPADGGGDRERRGQRDAHLRALGPARPGQQQRKNQQPSKPHGGRLFCQRKQKEGGRPRQAAADVERIGAQGRRDRAQQLTQGPADARKQECHQQEGRGQDDRIFLGGRTPFAGPVVQHAGGADVELELRRGHQDGQR
jgi:hypothetical protein